MRRKRAGRSLSMVSVPCSALGDTARAGGVFVTSAIDLSAAPSCRAGAHPPASAAARPARDASRVRILRRLFCNAILPGRSVQVRNPSSTIESARSEHPRSPPPLRPSYYRTVRLSEPATPPPRDRDPCTVHRVPECPTRVTRFNFGTFRFGQTSYPVETGSSTPSSFDFSG